MNRNEIKAAIKALRAEMKENEIRKISCFNGGLTPEERRYNSRLFELEAALIKAKD